MKRAAPHAGPKVTLDEPAPRARREGVPGRAKSTGEANAKGESCAQAEPRFSPDPAAPTDRYRLVTPFSLRF